MGFTAPVLAQEEPQEAPAEEAATEDAAPAESAGEPAAAAAAPPEAVAETATEAPVETVPVKADEVAEKGEGTQLDTIEVTGSRLMRTDYETAQPVVVLSREDIEKSGLTDINEILRHLSIAGNNSVTPTLNRGFLSLGETSLDLRNLGGSHTLLLVNGRRWVTGLVSTQPNVSDFNTIPTSIIERIEILKDGASAIYGSDAIAGVVNVITRRDYEGAGITYQYGGYPEQGDGQNQQVFVDWGRTTASNSVFVNLSYTQQGLTYTQNREFTKSPIPEAGKTRWSTNTERGRFAFIPTAANGSFYQCPNLQGPVAASVVADPFLSPVLQESDFVPAGLQLCTLHLIPGAEGGAMGDYRQTVQFEDYYNRFIRDSLTQPSERTALFTQWTQQLGDHMNLSVEGLYNMRRSTGLSFNLAFAGGDLLDDSGRTGFHMDHPLNPFNQNVGIDTSTSGLGVGYGAWTMRMVDDRANLQFKQAVDTIRLGGTLRGDFELLEQPVSWDAGYIFARNKIEEIVPLARFDRLQQQVLNSVDPDTGVVSYDPDACPAPCVPVNPFNGQAGFDYNAVTYAYYDTFQRNRGGQDIYFVDLSGQLPAGDWLAGPLAVATGFEMREDHYFSVIDPVIKAGDLVIINQQQDSGGENTSKEAYLEFGIPILKDLPGASALDLDIAGRHSQYPGFGSIFTYKTGLRWQPIDELLVRGTYSTGFRAPSIAELFLPAAVSGDPMADPCADPAKSDTTAQRCADDGAATANGQLNSPYGLWRGDPNLDPEESVNITYGVIYSPEFIPDLNVGLDFYKITVSEYITIGGGLAQYFLDNCYKAAEQNYCEYVHRTDEGELDYVDVPFFNLGKIETEGVDFDVDYLLPVPEAFGKVKWRLNTSYLTRYDIYTPQPNQPDVVTGAVGQAVMFGGWPRWKAGTEFSWESGVWNASWTTRLAYHMVEQCNDYYPGVPSYRELGLCSDPRPPVPDDPSTVDDPSTPEVENNEALPDLSTNKWDTLFYHNVQFGRELPAFNADISIGINNVLDQDPPTSLSQVGSVVWFNYDPNNFETPGRFAYLRASFKF